MNFLSVIFEGIKAAPPMVPIIFVVIVVVILAGKIRSRLTGF